MNESQKLMKKKILAVLTDILKRGNLTIADCFVVEILLAQADVVSRVSGKTLHIYNEPETELDVIEFLCQYREQIKNRK